MIIGVISDSHDRLEKIEKAVEVFNKKSVEKVIHAGDLVSPFTSRIFKNLNVPLHAVYGNNDGEKFGLKKLFDIQDQPLKLNVDSARIIVVHEADYLQELENSSLYDIIIYGHTHIVDVRKNNKVLVMNPGESCGYVNGKATIAILDSSKKDVEIVEI